MSISKYVNVVLPFSIDRLFTYKVPVPLIEEVSVGKRVEVPFGKKKIISAIIHEIHSKKPSYNTKEVVSVIDKSPILTSELMSLWEWVSAYYMTSLGEVMQAGLPASFKLSSTSLIELNKHIGGLEEIINVLESDNKNIKTDAVIILRHLSRVKNAAYDEIRKLLNKNNIYDRLQYLSEHGFINIEEKLKKREHHYAIKGVEINKVYNSGTSLEDLLISLKRAPKQLKILIAYMNLKETKEFVPIDDLLLESAVSRTILNAMIKKGIFTILTKPYDPFSSEEKQIPLKDLSHEQEEVRVQLKKNFKTSDIALLHGVTSSGKTEIYTYFIKEVLAKNKQVLYLIPEIALTEQIITKLKTYFGDPVIFFW